MYPDNLSESNPGLDPSLQSWVGQTADGHHPDGDPGTRHGAVDLRRYVMAIRRYLWLVILLTVLGGMGGVVAANLSDAVYLAQATVWIEQDQGESGPIRTTQLLGGVGWVDLLRSFSVLDSAVLRLKLFVRPALPKHRPLFLNFELQDGLVPGQYRLAVDRSGTRVVLSRADGAVIEEVAVGDSVGGGVGFAWVPPPEKLESGMEVPFSVAPPRDAARGLGSNLRTIPSRNSGILRVELLGTSPQLAAATVNVVVERFVQVAAFLKRAKLTERAKILAAQLESAERNLARAENALESFRINTITLPSDAPVTGGLQATQGPVLNQFFRQRLRREQLERSRDAVRAALNVRNDSVFSLETLGSLPAVQNSSEIMSALTKLTDVQATLIALRLQYTDEHPIVQNAEREVRELKTVTLPPLLRDLAQQLTARLRELDAQLETSADELSEIPPRAIEEARLRREVAVTGNLYNELMLRYETAKLAEASSVPDVRVLDPAVAPVRPVRNRDAILMLLGLAAGFGTSILGAVLLDQTDRRVRYPDQVSVDLGLPVLGVIPHFRTRAKQLKTKDSAAVTEAMRGLRMNLLHAHGTAGPIMITVGSADAGAGKTFVASNLALSFAEAGFHTLLIDADTRRGRLHRVMNLPRKPGLTDHLRGQAVESEIVRRAGSDLLYFVGAGTRTESAPELLSSTAMSDFVKNLRTGPQRAAIIFDSPPLAAGIDAFTLSTLCGNLVMVVRLGSTDRQLAGVKLDVLDRLPVRVLGAVINDAPAGSSYGYYSYYLPGYESEREDGEPPRLPGPVA